MNTTRPLPAQNDLTARTFSTESIWAGNGHSNLPN